jgi:eukaryotic-like serine/threonine-protein kinase
MIIGQWESVKEILHQAMQLRPEPRARFLDKACCSDTALRAEVESLLLAEEGVRSSFLECVPSFGRSEEEDSIDTTGALEAEQSSRFQLLRKLGEGGMGQVWLAEQVSPVRRQVALKLIKAGIYDEACVERFQSERQSLAIMDHPAIARVFDAGSTPQGAPYFVMEYVAGVSITAYCDSHRLNTRERLELFVRVCEGVQHAHQKAIIHRDLKPSNILVTEVDGRPAPKIIDFGVAKALTRKLATEMTFTCAGAIVGTPEYMSPEQAGSPGEDIDTRTDVYSLGAVFYELLAGVPPLDLRPIPFEEFLRRLREEEPPKPSTRIRCQAKEICGDLDSIALKALEKDRLRRYSSPSDFAADIQRYLKNEAVLAVPPSLGYRAGKFARRYRGPLATACAFVLVLILAAAISIWQSVRATKQRDRADAESAAAQAIDDFLQNDLLGQASPANQPGPNAKPNPHLEVRTALDRAAARIAGRFDRQPDVEAAIRGTIGQTYLDLGLYPEARTQLERAFDLHSRVLGPENPKTLRTMSRLGTAARHQGKYAESEALFRRAMETQRRVLGAGHGDTLYSMNGLGTAYRGEGKYAQAEALDRQDLEIRRRLLGPEHPNTLVPMTNLALDYREQGKYSLAEEISSQTLEMKRRVLGPEHPATLKSMNNLADIYSIQGKYAIAGKIYRETAQIQSRVLGREHPDTLLSMNNLAETFIYQRKYEQAGKLLNQTLEIKSRVFGPGDPNTLYTLWDFAFMYQREGKYTLAQTYAAQVLVGRRHTLGSEHPETMEAAADLALAYLSQGKFTGSEPLARETLRLYRTENPDDWRRFRAESLLGASLAGQKKYAEAEPLLLQGYRGMLAHKEQIAVPDRYHLDRARQWLAQLYQAWDRPAKAAE